jgi:iron complex outermembrane receptor protein
VTARAAVTLQDLGLRNSFLRLQGRFQNRYAFASGFWDSTKFYTHGRIPARFVADLAVGYRFASGVTVSGNIFNLFDDHGIDVLGAPPGGIVGYAQLAYNIQPSAME